MSVVEVDEVTGEIIEVSPTNTALVAAGEHETKVSTAKRYPRSITKFKRTASELATLDEATAASCIYAVPRGGKSIEGPSVRLAEIIAYSFGNITFGSRIVDVGDKTVTAQGFCYDYENNVQVMMQQERNILTSTGKRYGDDMINVTGRAACAIAMREAIFKVIPRALWESVYQSAREASIGKGKTVQQQRSDCLAFWKKAGVTEKQVLDLFGCKGLDDLSVDHLIQLRGMATAMKEEGIAADAMFQREDATRKVAKAAPIGGES